MSKITLFVICCLMTIYGFSQPKSFEGTVVYKVDITSKSENVTAEMWRKYAMMGDSLVVNIKDGNYKRTCGPTEEYYIAKDEKVYIKLRGRDTLYYRPYNDDTTKVLEALKTDETKEIASYTCKVFTLKSVKTIQKWYYSPALYHNPDYDKNNTIGGYNRFSTETSSIWLQSQDEYIGSLTVDSKAVKVKTEAVDDHIFDLPKLPLKKFSNESFYIPASFRGGMKNWVTYLQGNLNVKLALKNIKLKRGEESASQVAYVSFIVMENGELSNIKVINPDDVHPKLAQEAIRVVTESNGNWLPAKLLNEKVIYRILQPITFQVTRE